jgi:multiple sugar transport system permease protein
MQRLALKSVIGKIIFYFFLINIVLLFFFPFYWVVRTSLMSAVDAGAMPPKFFFEPILDNYLQVLNESDFIKSLWNSTVVVFFTLAANLIISLPAAYIIARHRQKWLSFTILFFQMAPWIVLLLPWYIIFNQLGLYDTYIGLVLSNLTYMIPLTIWLMLGFFEDIPVEVEEAAWLDGCSHLGTFIRVVIPLVKGGIITICTLGFMFTWNIFMFPLVLAGYNSKTLPVMIYGFLADNQLDFGPLSAAAVLITLPVVAFTLINQKYFRKGIALGGRK